MLILYSATLFISAALLFWVQPLFARMILPILGGVPAVWNTSMIFFQIMVLLGYAWAHLSTRWLGLRRQSIIHLVLATLAALSLPVRLIGGKKPPLDVNPVFWLLFVMAISIGLPAFIASGTAPLLQKWFASTRHRSAGDPYFLYSASNLGSLTALLCYPSLLEPLLRIRQQSAAWAAGYILLIILLALSAVVLWQSPASRIPGRFWGLEPRPHEPVIQPSERPSWKRKVRWLLLSFAPASLLLGVTSHITVNIAAVPLFWIIPLAIYLLSYALVFARKAILPHRWMILGQPLSTVGLVLSMAIGIDTPLYTFPLHLSVFFLSAMVCHGELAADRPAADHLTQFYLFVSAGGVLGGLFNALAAPLLFSSFIEYPLMLIAVGMLRPGSEKKSAALSTKCLDFALPAIMSIFLGGIILTLRKIPSGMGAPVPITFFKASCLGAGLACLAFLKYPVRFSLGMGSVIMAIALAGPQAARIIFSERNFFGAIRVEEYDNGQHLLMNGTTLHGAQNMKPEFRAEPLLYYQRASPLGDIFDALQSKLSGKNVAIIGLGAGTIAAYGKAGQRYDFYEINPAVAKVAEDNRYFTYLADSRARVKVILGDARLKLEAAPDHYYSMIIMDAFSSDAIPVHLLTREAIRLYVSKLSANGVLAFHTSNRYVDLAPVLTNLAGDAGLQCLFKTHPGDPHYNYGGIHTGSHWMVMVRDLTHMGTLYEFPDWDGLTREGGFRVWTDDYANVLGVLHLSRW